MKHTMGNIAYTGSIDFGSSSMYGDVERKGGAVMSNRPHTSDMSGMSDIIGMADIIGMQDIIGAGTYSAEQLEEMKKKNAAKEAAAKDAKDTKHAAAAIKIDTRISKLLKPEFASAYASAATTKSKPKFLDNTLIVLFGLASDDGVGGMVANVADAASQFGSIANLQRAIVRRLKERSSHMNRGWFSRLLQKEKRMDEFTQEEFQTFLGKLTSDRKGGSELVNKDKAATVPATMSVAKSVEVANAPIPLVSSPMATTQGMRLGKNPMGNAAVTGAEILVGHSLSGHRGEPMGNRAVTGIALGYEAYTGSAFPMSNMPVTGADLALGYESYTGYDTYTGSEAFRRGSGRVVNVGADHAEAAAAIDERIASILKPYWSALYRVATMGNMFERKCASNSLMVAMLSDDGLASMVKSVAEAEAQFQNLGLMQRAMARRIRECCTWAGRAHSTGAELMVAGMSAEIFTAGDVMVMGSSCGCTGACLCNA